MDIDTFTAPGLAKQIETVVSTTAWKLHAEVGRGYNRLDARPPRAEFEALVLERFGAIMTDPSYI